MCETAPIVAVYIMALRVSGALALGVVGTFLLMRPPRRCAMDTVTTFAGALVQIEVTYGALPNLNKVSGILDCINGDLSPAHGRKVDVPLWYCPAPDSTEERLLPVKDIITRMCGGDSLLAQFAADGHILSTPDHAPILLRERDIPTAVILTNESTSFDYSHSIERLDSLPASDDDVWIPLKDDVLQSHGIVVFEVVSSLFRNPDSFAPIPLEIIETAVGSTTGLEAAVFLEATGVWVNLLKSTDPMLANRLVAFARSGPGDHTCAICLEDVPVIDNRPEGCGHWFHGQCITKWITQQRGEPLCPNCRKPLIV